MPTSPPTIDALPTAPDRADRATFSARATAFFAALKDTFASQVSAVASNAYANAAEALASAAASLASANNAAASAATSVAAAGATIWISGTTYAIGDVRYSPANQRIYRRKTSGAGTTDPSADSTNWGVVDVGPVPVTVTGTTQTAVAGTHYILTNVAATTVTLPATPTSGDMVWVTWTNSLDTNVIARNGQTIMGGASDMTLDASINGTVQLRFVNSSWRLV